MNLSVCSGETCCRLVFSPMNISPLNTLDLWCKQTYGKKLYKIALDIGLTCPNRDGTLGTGGCIFCSGGGSGEHAVSAGEIDLAAQLLRGKLLLGAKAEGCGFIAYFQAFTNTYGPISYLRSVYTQALSWEECAGISIATRPDCLPPEVLSLLQELRKSFPDKFIWVELGLQTIHEDTARYIRRGYELSCFEESLEALRKIDIPVIVHVILGLPGEDRERMLSTIRYLNGKKIFGIKLQLLHVLKDTDLAVDYEAGRFQVLGQEEYLELLCCLIAALDKDIVIHRLTGDGPRQLLIAPTWTLHKRFVLNSLHHMLKVREIYQGMDADISSASEEEI